MSASAAARVTTLPSVRELTREQRERLMTELVKAWFEEVGCPFPLVVRDGEAILGTFMPGFVPGTKSTIPDLPEDYRREIERRIATTREEDLLTSEQALEYLEKALCEKRTKSLP